MNRLQSSMCNGVLYGSLCANIIVSGIVNVILNIVVYSYVSGLAQYKWKCLQSLILSIFVLHRYHISFD